MGRQRNLDVIEFCNMVVKDRGKVGACSRCGGTGKVEVGYASAENGPTNDPAAEIGVEFCDCSAGYALWFQDAEENERTNAAFFASLTS